VNDQIDSILAITGINNPDKIIEKFNKLRILFEFQFNEAKTWFNTVRTPGIEINAKHECIRIYFFISINQIDTCHTTNISKGSWFIRLFKKHLKLIY